LGQGVGLAAESQGFLVATIKIVPQELERLGK
jgi:hypothetical protein